MLKINQQEMTYSLIGEEVPEYETDENGNIKYDGYTDDDGNFIPYLDEDGNKIPLPTGGIEQHGGEHPVQEGILPVILHELVHCR